MRLKTIKGRVVPIFKDQGVIKAAIFGSFATGENKKNSDIDFLVKFQRLPSLLDLSRLKLKIEGKVGMDVDIITYDGLSPRLKKLILEEQQIIYEKKT